MRRYGQLEERFAALGGYVIGFMRILPEYLATVSSIYIVVPLFAAYLVFLRRDVAGE